MKVRELKRERSEWELRAKQLEDALTSMLNLEGACLLGANSGAFYGLDVEYHFNKARAALRGQS